jgi:hypothetical protein
LPLSNNSNKLSSLALTTQNCNQSFKVISSLTNTTETKTSAAVAELKNKINSNAKILSSNHNLEAQRSTNSLFKSTDRNQLTTSITYKLNNNNNNIIKNCSNNYYKTNYCDAKSSNNTIINSNRKESVILT